MTKQFPMFAVAVLLASSGVASGASAHAGFPRRGKSHGCAARRQAEDRNARPAAGGTLPDAHAPGPGDDRRSSILTEENGAWRWIASAAARRLPAGEK